MLRRCHTVSVWPVLSALEAASNSMGSLSVEQGQLASEYPFLCLFNLLLNSACCILVADWFTPLTYVANCFGQEWQRSASIGAYDRYRFVVVVDEMLGKFVCCIVTYRLACTNA